MISNCCGATVSEVIAHVQSVAFASMRSTFFAERNLRIVGCRSYGCDRFFFFFVNLMLGFDCSTFCA